MDSVSSEKIKEKQGILFLNFSNVLINEIGEKTERAVPTASENSQGKETSTGGYHRIINPWSHNYKKMELQNKWLRLQ